MHATNTDMAPSKVQTQARHPIKLEEVLRVLPDFNRHLANLLGFVKSAIIFTACRAGALNKIAKTIPGEVIGNF